MEQNKLYIFRGLPGSGKSTLAHKMAPLVIESDMFRYTSNMVYVYNSYDNMTVNAKAFSLLNYAIKHLAMPAIALTAVHTKVGYMARFARLAKRYNYKVIVVECRGKYGNIHNVPEGTIASMRDDFEPLTQEKMDELGIDEFIIK